ncbi:hypothetical protein [Gymnodinialimonas sp.]
MTPSEREDIIETALRAEFKRIWDWEPDVVEHPFGPDDTDYIEEFNKRLSLLREIARSDLRKLSNEALVAIRDDPPNEFTIRTAPFEAHLTVDPSKFRIRQPPAIAYGYGHPHFAPEFTYWCQMPNLSLYEAAALAVGDDPERMTEEKIHGLKKRGASGTTLWAAHKFLLKRLEQFIRIYPHTGFGFGRVSLHRLDKWFKEIDLEIHPDFCAAIDTQLGTKTATGNPTHGTLRSQERTTLLKLIAAMACEQYGYDPSASRSEVPSRIAEDLDLVGLSMDPKTVRKWLRDSAELVDQSYWKRDT